MTTVKSNELVKHIDVVDVYLFFFFYMLVRETFKLIKQKDKIFWLSMLDIANKDASDSDNGKINYLYADQIEKEKLLLQNLLKSMRIKPKKKKEIWTKVNRKK